MNGRSARVAERAAFWLPAAAAGAATAVFGTIAADGRWLAAMGDYIVRHGSIPDFVPYASAPSRGWHNVPVLGELIFHALEALGGERAFLIAQVVAVVSSFALLAYDMRRRSASGAGSLFALLLLIPAAFPALLLVRAQLFSLALFPLLGVLLRAEARRPSWHVWLLPPLFALWSNVHGAVLVGLAVAGAYLLIDRARHQLWVAVCVLAGSALALFATPALWLTGSYYAGVLGNESARRGVGLWAPLSVQSGPDDVLITCGLVLAVAALRARPRLWELAAMAGLAVLTVHVVRGGVWFAFFAAVPAASALGRGSGPRARVAVPMLAVLLALVIFGLVRGPHQSGAGRGLLAGALAQAAGTPVLATDLLAEQLALSGGRVWIGNPIDAFRRQDQRLYLDWLQGRPAGDAALGHAPRVVLVRPGLD